MTKCASSFQVSGLRVTCLLRRSVSKRNQRNRHCSYARYAGQDEENSVDFCDLDQGSFCSRSAGSKSSAREIRSRVKDKISRYRESPSRWIMMPQRRTRHARIPTFAGTGRWLRRPPVRLLPANPDAGRESRRECDEPNVVGHVWMVQCLE